MKARIYQITITTDLIHGLQKRIREIYIPDIKIGVNYADHELNVIDFNSDDANFRYSKNPPMYASLISEFEVGSIVDVLNEYNHFRSVIINWFETVEYGERSVPPRESA